MFLKFEDNYKSFLNSKFEDNGESFFIFFFIWGQWWKFLKDYENLTTMTDVFEIWGELWHFSKFKENLQRMKIMIFLKFEENDESFFYLRRRMKVFVIWGELWKFLKFEENDESFAEGKFLTKLWDILPCCLTQHLLLRARPDMEKIKSCKYTFVE